MFFSLCCRGDHKSNKQLKRAASGREMQLESRMKLAARGGGLNWGTGAAPMHAELELEVKLAVRKNDYLNKSLSFEPHCNRTVTEQ